MATRITTDIFINKNVEWELEELECGTSLMITKSGAFATIWWDNTREFLQHMAKAQMGERYLRLRFYATPHATVVYFLPEQYFSIVNEGLKKVVDDNVAS